AEPLASQLKEPIAGGGWWAA
nr:RecName: Full=Protease inhibitor; Short=AmPI [Antheraea mylitta]